MQKQIFVAIIGHGHVRTYFHSNYKSICTYFTKNNHLTVRSVASYVMGFMHICVAKKKQPVQDYVQLKDQVAAKA